MKLSLMPLGVEHKGGTLVEEQIVEMKLSLMPLGVEHI